MNERVKLHQVFFETRKYGKYLRVSAIDPISNTEAVSTGPITLGEEALKHAAKMKLEYILTKQKK
ncbi:MAG: hypothetical protein HWE34_10720 [Methylocystaceae bacterium]|nr:hypothetical protein [Methylocystaceae bacterium]